MTRVASEIQSVRNIINNINIELIRLIKLQYHINLLVLAY